MAEKETASGTGIRDVARLAGVAPSTVSRVLNNRVDGVRISAATSERVRQAAQTLRYQPNAAARSLRTMQNQTIGVIAFNLLHPFTAALLRVIYASCAPRGYHLLVGNADPSVSEGWILADILSPDRVDGLLLIGDLLRRAGGREDMEHLVQTHQHVVAVSGRPSIAGEHSVMVDNAAGVTMALEYLAGLGHRNIGYGMEDKGPESWEDRQRYEAYRHFLESHELPYDPAQEMSVPSHTTVEGAGLALRRLLALPRRPTALLVNNDSTAIVILKAALESGIRIPADLSLMGFDDIAFAALCSPGLTTVRQPIDEIGAYATDLLLDMVSGVASAAPANETRLFSPDLVRRDSCGPPAGLAGPAERR